MVDKLKTYKIPFTGLKEGVHRFEFRLDGKFFEEFGNEELGESEFYVDLDLDKQATFMDMTIQFEGSFHTECDRCLNNLELELGGERTFLVKSEGDPEDEDMIILGPQDTELDVANSLYETIVAALPLKRAHSEDDCDPEVLERLDTYSHIDSEEIDPRWDALKKLKKD